MKNSKDDIFRKIETEKQKLYEIKRMVKGSISKVKNAYILTFKGKGNITKTVYIKKEKLEEVEFLISNYKLAKKIFNKITDLNIEFLKLDR